MADYPALRLDAADLDRALAVADDYSPTAVDEHESTTRVFFSAADARDRAHAALAAAGVSSDRIDVDDEDWARRSQENLKPITVGRVTLVSRQSPVVTEPPQVSNGRPPIVLVIPPSMGFGTGHHATTRLCLAAMQTLDLSGAFVLDVGTGSGVLAIAASRLGARRALGIDSDADAVRSARESLDANPDAGGVAFELVDLVSGPLPQADVVTANLTGALLAREARRLAAGIRRGGTLIVSGLLVEEREAVRAAFGDMDVAWAAEEDGWVGLTFRYRVGPEKPGEGVK